MPRTMDTEVRPGFRMGKDVQFGSQRLKRPLKAREMGKTPAPTNLTLPATFSARLFDGARKVHLDAGQPLFRVGDPGDGCYWVDEGLLKVHVILTSPGGDVRILAILGAAGDDCRRIVHV